ncbi:hypothetical protein G7Z17_g11662 [Cylindrodendrum hubeiense]|uniref:Lytic polysaccharide monooxygenase n=1 Tax=Cylindrodendrum hubeiense TaxID=595255 RepID=A0A9P5L662_9HYPO|nr:hypothetical protein G7Z17_g11662 [Cylindrodendrum hubeiense]
MKVFQSLALAFGLVGLAQAHMQMSEPIPFNGINNTYAETKDYSMTSPLNADGSNFPCKGYHNLLGTPAGHVTATYAAGSSQKITIAGDAFHNGGSCQISLSYDKGTTWKVIQSYIGNCPILHGGSFAFTVPSDAPSGEAMLAWTWFNNTGNREMYMNCAAIEVTGGSSKRADALSSLPDMFVANIGGSCKFDVPGDLKFPDPGEQVTVANTEAKDPVGCGSGSGSGSGSGDSTSVVAGTTAAATYTQPAATTAAPADDTSVPGGVFITVSSGPADSVSTTVADSVPTTVADSVPTTIASTLVTVTKSASNSVPSATTPVASPTSGSGDGSSSGSHTAGTACTTEGEWNCVGGTQFQRCASGTWSVLMAVADGTTCESGSSDALSISSARRRRAFRSFRARF